ncbi:hypothetical protein [Methanobrevibacter curvatus]|nr:hypothetical protein [Methanobrevibacter curvatus]
MKIKLCDKDIYKVEFGSNWINEVHNIVLNHIELNEGLNVDNLIK